MTEKFQYWVLLVSMLFIGMFSLSAQNPTWKCVKNKNGIQVYSKKSDSAKYKIIKTTTTLKTSLSALVFLITDPPDQHNWVYMNKKAEILEKKNPFTWVIYSQAMLPWPITDRDIVSRYVLVQDSVTKIITVSGEAIPRFRPDDPDHVRIPFAKSRWRFIPLNDSVVDIEFTLAVDVGGNIPHWLANMAAAKGPFQTLLGLKKEIKRKKYREAHLSFIKEP